jgi:hypothetical protein
LLTVVKSLQAGLVLHPVVACLFVDACPQEEVLHCIEVCLLGVTEG